MTPYYADDWLMVYQGDCREVMASMEPESVQCVVTSPPYWGLRDYGDAGQLGLEPTPEAYVASMVEVFREVRRVLRSDGTVWLNLGDSYAAGGGSGEQRLDELGVRLGTGGGKKHSSRPSGRAPLGGLKPKDLVGIPWRVAFALQADGWYLRSDIIWSKPNPMPESVTDRPTKSHEYLFLLSKSARYHFDADAVRETGEYVGTGLTKAERLANTPELSTGVSPAAIHQRGPTAMLGNPAGRNIRSVWTIATQPYPGAHFATFPPKLVEPCVKAGCPSKVCSECGAGWERVVERTRGSYEGQGRPKAVGHAGYGSPSSSLSVSGGSKSWQERGPKATTTGWRPTCAHDAPTEAGVVLDPFAGSGTTGMVAQALGRRAVLIDLNGDYLVQAMRRNQQSPLGLDGAS